MSVVNWSTIYGPILFFLRFEFDEMKRVDQIDFNKKKRIDFDRFIFFFFKSNKEKLWFSSAPTFLFALERFFERGEK